MTAYRRIEAGDAPGGDGAVDEAARALASEAVLAHPTQTVYGLGAGPARLDRALARLKGRDENRPLLRIAADVDTFRRERPALRWTPEGERLARRFWPGPLTLVLPDGTERGLAVRVEGHPLTRAVLERAGMSMSSTSLNRTGRSPARTSAEVETTLDAMPTVEAEVVWVDAGDLDPSPPSTVVSLLGGRPRVLREGAIAARDVESCLGERGGSG